MQQALVTKLCLLALFCAGLPHYSVAKERYCMKELSPVQNDNGIKVEVLDMNCVARVKVIVDEGIQGVKGQITIDSNGMKSIQEIDCGDDCMGSASGMCASVDPPSSQDGDISLAADEYLMSECSGDVLEGYAPNDVKVNIKLEAEDGIIWEGNALFVREDDGN